MRAKVSALIIARDEERNIGRCLESVLWADEIVVIDSGSKDRTIEICRTNGARVIETPWLGFGPTRNLGLDSVINEWVLTLDADEQVPRELQEEIRALLERGPEHDAYRIRYDTLYLGRLMKHGGWSSEWHVRLFRRTSGRYREVAVHESLAVTGTRGALRSPMLHHSYPNLAAHVEKINTYTTLAASQMHKDGKRTSIAAAVARGMAAFARRYILKAGFLDGREGFVLAVNSGYYSFLKYAKLWAILSSRS